ncbi:glycoside hydrolase family 13 protein [Hortaea werneckii]|nr:glycoside hydrolase family 13 protein [Hortaea werneckii]
MTLTQRPWWKDVAIYQIYPASFQDSNGDGIGDLQGIIQRLDYIKSVGVDVVWVCPMYESPQLDMGYDISDYQAIYGPYGTMADMDQLIAEVHRRGMRIILDLVVNHTSDQHSWFKESRSSKSNPKRDWYIWKPANSDERGNRKPPNNWRSNFGGSAWKWDEHTQEYYLHLFCPEQPDLNWDNNEARRAIYETAMIYWLEKGADGFRVDTVNMYSKDPSFPNAPITDHEAEWQEAGLVYCNGPRMNEYLSEMNSILTRYDAMTVGECPFTPDRNKVIDYVGASKNRLSMVFQFDVVDVGPGKIFKFQTAPFAYKLHDLKDAIARTQGLLHGTDAWTTSFVENHDQARAISRFGDDGPQWRERSGKLLSLLFASLSGTLFIYQGQEIGMINMPPDWPIEEYKDVDSINYYSMVAQRSGNNEHELSMAKKSLQHLSRDHARTPMQWDSARNGGFTGDSVEPWMRMNPRMLALRKQANDVLVNGHFELVDEANETVFSFLKHGKTRSALVVCNFSSNESRMPQIASDQKKEAVMDNVSEATNINAKSMQYQARAEFGDDNFFVALLSDLENLVLPFHPAITMAEAQSAIETMSESQEARAFVKTTPESSDISKWVSMSLDALRPVLLQENISVRRVATLQFLHVCFMGLGRYDIAFYYLRQSVAMLEILRIKDSSSMLMLPFTERSQRQRLYWTIHERFYAVACHRPAILQPLETLPEPDGTIPIDINAGFIQIIRLFLHIDDDMLSKWFATFDSEQHIDLSWVLEKHQQIDAETAGGRDEVACLSNRQQVDLFITKHWMRMLVWQIAMSKCLLSSGSSEQSMSLSFPIGISKHLRELITSVSKQDIEVHGSCIQQKLIELTDTIAGVVLTVPASSPQERRQRVDDFNFLFRFCKSLPRPNSVLQELLESKHRKLAEIEI